MKRSIRHVVFRSSRLWLWRLARHRAATSGPLVRALWLVQRYGTADAVDPANDQRVKGALFKALGKEGELTLSEAGGIHGA